MRVPNTNPTALWLGAILLACGLYMLVRVPDWGLPILTECSLGLTLLALGLDTRRMWRPWDAAKVGACTGAFVAVLTAMTAQRVWLAPIAGLGCVVVAAGIGAITMGSDRRLVAQLVAAYRANRPIEPYAVAAVKTARRVVFEVAFLLVEWGRFDILEQLAVYAFVPHAESLRRFYLALAMHAKGRYAEAMELARTTNQLDQGPYVREHWEQLVARIQIASGEAPNVIASFSPTCSVAHPALAVERKLVLADAYATIGDAEAAKRLVANVASSRAFLEKLGNNPRPASLAATSLLSQPDSPYR